MKLLELQVREITPKITHLIFPTQYLMNASLARFSEYAEGKELQGKLFDWEDFQDWEAARSEDYSRQVRGHNLTSDDFTPFLEGRFYPLRRKEKTVLEIVAQKQAPFSAIATYGKGKNHLKHEIAHALFFLDQDYQEKARTIVEGIDSKKIKKHLARQGYKENNFIDEIQASLIEEEGLNCLQKEAGIDPKKYLPASERLKELFQYHAPQNWHDVEKGKIEIFPLPVYVSQRGLKRYQQSSLAGYSQEGK